MLGKKVIDILISPMLFELVYIKLSEVETLSSWSITYTKIEVKRGLLT